MPGRLSGPGVPEPPFVRSSEDTWVGRVAGLHACSELPRPLNGTRVDRYLGWRMQTGLRALVVSDCSWRHPSRADRGFDASVAIAEGGVLVLTSHRVHDQFARILDP